MDITNIDINIDQFTPSNQLELDEADRSERETLRRLQKQVKDSYMIIEKNRNIRTSLDDHDGASPVIPIHGLSSSAKRKKFSPISPEVKALVVQKIYYEGSMTYEEAEKNYEISKYSIIRIIKSEKEKLVGEDPPVLIPKKRGRRSTLNNEMLVYILIELEKDSQLI